MKGDVDMNCYNHSLCCIKRISTIIIHTLASKYEITKINVIDSLYDSDVITICIFCSEKKWEDIKKEFSVFIL